MERDLPSFTISTFPETNVEQHRLRVFCAGFPGAGHRHRLEQIHSARKAPAILLQDEVNLNLKPQNFTFAFTFPPVRHSAEAADKSIPLPWHMLR